MSRQRALLLAALAVVVAAGGFYAWRISAGSSDRIEVAGDVRSEVRVVTTPAIITPTPDYTIGIPVPAGSAAAKKSQTGGVGSSGAASGSSGSAASSQMPAVAGMLTSVTVTVGDQVKAGDVIATLDTTLLDLGVEAARLAAVRAKADVGVLDSGLNTIADNRSKLSSAKGKLASTASQLTSTRAKLTSSRATLVATRAKAIAGRTQLTGQIKQLEALIASGNATSTPPAPTPQQLLAGMKAKLVQLNAGIAKMDAGLKQIDAGLAKIAQGLGKLPSARAKIATGQSALDSAAQRIGDAKDVLGILADAKVLGVRSAEIARDAAVITAPVSGTVSFARRAGTVAMVGAPLVRIHPDTAPLVDTYLTAEQIARIAVGDRAELTIDSLPDRTFTGAVTLIGSSYRYPPNSFPTPLTHMTRAARVTITLDDGSTVPVGTPGDLVIHPTTRD